MKQTGGIKDYSEKRAQSILNHYYEMSYPDRRNVGRAGMLTKIKITIPAWLRMLERLVVHIKEMDERREKLKAKRNADELIAEETAEEIDRKIAEISEGDILAFRNAGAYCFTMASNYNSRFRPPEVLWYKEEAHLIRKEETLKDLTQNQILIDFNETASVN